MNWLTPEARQRLAPYYDEDYANKLATRLAALPAPLNKIGRGLAGLRKTNESLSSADSYERQRQARNALCALSALERLRLFYALFPSIAKEVEAGWELFDYLPYQADASRRPFRIKQSEDQTGYTMIRRSHWVVELIEVIAPYNQPITWFAEWAANLGMTAPNTLGFLFAGVINQGGPTGQAVFEILTASARGEHPVGRMGRHVCRALLSASRPDGWEFMERMLLAAQREEGLRQVILETIDEAHPQAFRRMLGIVIDNNLLRFSAVVRAAAVWTGLRFEAAEPKTLLKILIQIRRFLADPAARQTALDDGDAQDAYLALWSIAFEDILGAIGSARRLLTYPDAEHRFASTYFLYLLRIRISARDLIPVLEDKDLRVAVCAFWGINMGEEDFEWLQSEQPDMFEIIERFIKRLPEKEKTLIPILWDWMALSVDQQMAAGLLARSLGDRPIERLLPYLRQMPYSEKLDTVKRLIKQIDQHPEYRMAILDLIGDKDTSIQTQLFSLLEKFKIHPAEAPKLEAFLTRKSANLRLGVMQLLMKQDDADLLNSIDRLLAQRNEQQRLAGLEMLREMSVAKRQPTACRERVRRLQDQALPEAEKYILADLLVQDSNIYTLKDALGLANLDNTSKPGEPCSKNTLFGFVKKVRLGTKAAAGCIHALEKLIEEHRTDTVQVVNWQNADRTELLGNARWGFASPDPALSREENMLRFPMAEVWENWFRERPAGQRDEDGYELLRAQAALTLLTNHLSSQGSWIHAIPRQMRTYLDEPYELELNYEAQIASVLHWLIYLHPTSGSADFLLDAFEELLARLGRDPVRQFPEHTRDRWTYLDGKLRYLQVLRFHRQMHPEEWQAQHHARLWGLVHWLEPFAKRNGKTYTTQLEDVLFAHEVGAATEDDLLLFLLAEPVETYYGARHFPDLQRYSSKRHDPLFEKYPVLEQAIERCRARILSIELHRGDLPTAASRPALALRSVPGTENMLRILRALGKTEFDRRVYWFNDNRVHVLSHLIRVSFPTNTDTLEDFATHANNAHIPATRLVELAVYAPQWARYVEHALGWPGMADGVWWVYAHTKDRQWQVDEEIRAMWTAEIGEHTPLTVDSLMDGAVDVAWFRSMIADLGEERWQAVYKAALYAASGTGHARARLFADAMLGKLSAGELVERVQSKRNQDALRALGLVPLPEDSACQPEILRRYRVMVEFLRTSKQFGSQRQASEKLAAGIAMENLARTAGFPDPQRLEWAMELEAVADLADGPVSAEVDGVRVTLSIDDLGEAEIACTRGEKELKSIPPAVKKDARIGALTERKKELERQAKRMRQSLETAMIRGDEFTAGEIQALFHHPVLRVLFQQLVFVSLEPEGQRVEGQETGAQPVMGYPVEGGLALEGLDGRRIELAAGDQFYDARLRIAHPFDLLQSGCWHEWQRECFISERIQPFKQVFRELYVLTTTEQDEKNYSRRYAGQQVNPRQALALFGGRGWVVAPEEGVYKTFHTEGITARVGFLQSIYTPAEVEGLTIELVGFTRRGEWLPLKLEQVPPRLFSEVMRDLDLVVSVAHAGGVDPEASASTVESRAALVQETCTLLRLANVRVENHHALVDGRLGNYTIHLGSAVVHKQPGGSLCIVPVHAQHRGRLFLPFVDNDPKTAEVVSKVILLAKDNEIKDPSILEQILR